MTLTKFDIVEGLKNEVNRLSANINKLDAKEYRVLAGDDTDVTGALRKNLADCAFEINKLGGALELLHVAQP